MTRNKTMIVAGMHRSGTSLITQWLQRCGLHVGDNLLGADTGNDNGHFEDLDFLDSHKAILKSQRLSDNGFTAVPLKPLSCSDVDRLKDIIAYKNSIHVQWGWKDPRTCLFLETYHSLLPDAFYFVVLRDYQSVIASLVYRMYSQKEAKYAGRKGIGGFLWRQFLKKRKMETLRKKYTQRFLQIWINYNQAVLNHINRLPEEQYMVADYTVLVENDRMVFEQLVHQYGFNLQYFDFSTIYKPKQLNKPYEAEAYIRDKSLLIKAVYIQESLQRKNIVHAPMKALAVL